MSDKFLSLLTRKHGLIGLSMTRIFFGIAFLYQLVPNWSQRYLLWGPAGLVPYGEYKKYAADQGLVTLFDLSSSPWLVDVMFLGGVVVALAYTLGYRTWLTGCLLAVFVWSFYYRNVYIVHGGDTVLRLQLTYLLFAHVGAHFSLDALRRKKKGDSGNRDRLWHDLAAAVHNFAWLAAVIQLAFIYFAAGTYKIQGSMWRDGTALYYASRVQDFYTPGLGEWLWQHDVVVVLLTHLTVLYQVAFPFLLLNRYTKYLALLTAFLFHAGIAVFMGLIDFSWIMIGCEFLLLTDRDYRMIAAGWRRLTSWIGSAWQRLREEGGRRLKA
ncbi:HTTM domain-containing protein [Lihuaxuella thermophila]|uniref:Vitamin K-dependent gamma-carboxylase n=1 Tax=Lihuaxuella thermophila TaxID=1173111 RepID=A0A1H8C6W0_9BACL|nr:HTTM domain-containing protein [Lihuaxuella thermophila]SEM90776.1 Vitamin K-dependent gamma-carboxylase [Lihuaxuella thermophila]